MTDETWNGGTGNWYDASLWSPAQVPQAGDTADLQGGTVQMDMVDASRITIYDGWKMPALDKDTTLDIGNSVLGNITLVGGNPVTPHGTPQAVFNIHGVAIFTGTIMPFDAGEGVVLSVNMAPASVLINTGQWNLASEGPAFVGINMSPADLILNQGVMDFGGEETAGNLTINADQKSDILVNAGTIILGGNATIDPAVIGTGNIELAGHPLSGDTVHVDFKNIVSAGETLQFASLAPQYVGVEQLTLDPQGFLGTITGFQAHDELVLPGVTATSEQYKAGVLTLFDAQRPVAALHVAGSYTSSSFALSSSNGTTVIQHS